MYALLSVTYTKQVQHDFGGLPALCVEAVLFQCIFLLPQSLTLKIASIMYILYNYYYICIL